MGLQKSLTNYCSFSSIPFSLFLSRLRMSFSLAASSISCVFGVPRPLVHDISSSPSAENNADGENLQARDLPPATAAAASDAIVATTPVPPHRATGVIRFPEIDLSAISRLRNLRQLQTTPAAKALATIFSSQCIVGYTPGTCRVSVTMPLPLNTDQGRVELGGVSFFNFFSLLKANFFPQGRNMSTHVVKGIGFK